MPNTTPAADEPGVFARVRGAAAASGSPVELLLHGAVTVGRAGERLAALGELADAGAVGFSDDGSPVKSAVILRNALLYAGMLGLPLVRARRGPGPDGRRGGERGVRRDDPRPQGLAGRRRGRRGGAGDRGADGRAAGCTWRAAPPDPPLDRRRRSMRYAGRRRPACRSPATSRRTTSGSPTSGSRGRGAGPGRRSATTARARDPWADGALVAHPVRHGMQGQPAAAVGRGRGRRAGGPRRRDRRRGRHRPRPAHPGRQGGRVRPRGERDQRRRDGAGGAARGGRCAAAYALARAIAALTTGPARVLGGAGRAPRRARARRGSAGRPRGLRRRSRPGRSPLPRSRRAAKNTPLLGRELPGRVLLTVADGRLAYRDPEA